MRVSITLYGTENAAVGLFQDSTPMPLNSSATTTRKTLYYRLLTRFVKLGKLARCSTSVPIWPGMYRLHTDGHMGDWEGQTHAQKRLFTSPPLGNQAFREAGAPPLSSQWPVGRHRTVSFARAVRHRPGGPFSSVGLFWRVGGVCPPLDRYVQTDPGEILWLPGQTVPANAI